MRLRPIIKLAAASAILLAAAAPNAAASTSPVATWLTVGPVPVSYPALQAAISGTLATRTATPAPVPDATITVYFQSYTGTAGSYALTTTLPGPGGIWAAFTGAPGYAATTGGNLDTPAYLALHRHARITSAMTYCLPCARVPGPPVQHCPIASPWPALAPRSGRLSRDTHRSAPALGLRGHVRRPGLQHGCWSPGRVAGRMAASDLGQGQFLVPAR